ncbi:MFS transporter small subunit [Streptomyces sp. 2A115]|uniref:MFS transporter small subunit n=1 Tax=Streptomyces sp. 2A115 TaxID=3457439 RepID=UPI003FD3A8A3
MSTSDSSLPDSSPPDSSPPGRAGLIAFAWVWVGAPLAYGLYELVRKATQLFTG